MKNTQWLHVGTLTDIPVRGSRRVKQGGNTIALFRTSENKVHAIADKCPHKGGPLSEGIVHDACVTCPLHNWVISLETGQAQGAAGGSTTVFPVKLEDENILIALSSDADFKDGMNGDVVEEPIQGSRAVLY